MGLPTIEAARAKLTERLAEHKGKITSKLFPVPPGRPATFRDYTGKTIGVMNVIGFLGAGKSTPWWVARCVECNDVDVRQANRLGEGRGAGTCRKCRMGSNAGRAGR